MPSARVQAISSLQQYPSVCTEARANGAHKQESGSETIISEMKARGQVGQECWTVEKGKQEINVRKV